MSFFGLTSMGVENPFEHSLVNAMAFKLFSEEEFLAAFKRIDKDGSGYIEADEVAVLLRETYGFDPLPEEIDYFMDEFDANKDNRVSFSEFSSALLRIKEKLDAKASKSKELHSFEKYRDSLVKHKRLDFEPTDKYKAAFTSSQVHGFKLKDDRELAYCTQPKHPKNSCHETRYAEEMIRTGFNS